MARRVWGCGCVGAGAYLGRELDCTVERQLVRIGDPRCLRKSGLERLNVLRKGRHRTHLWDRRRNVVAAVIAVVIGLHLDDGRISSPRSLALLARNLPRGRDRMLSSRIKDVVRPLLELNDKIYAKIVRRLPRQRPTFLITACSAVRCQCHSEPQQSSSAAESTVRIM